MRVPTSQSFDRVNAPRGCRRLAGRVIGLALKDVLLPASTHDGRSARSFLAGSRMLHYWCEVAGFDTHRIIRAAAAFIAVQDALPPHARLARGRYFLDQSNDEPLPAPSPAPLPKPPLWPSASIRR